MAVAPLPLSCSADAAKCSDPMKDVVDAALRISSLVDRVLAAHRLKLEAAERYPHLHVPTNDDLLGAILVGIAHAISDTDGLFEADMYDTIEDLYGGSGATDSATDDEDDTVWEEYERIQDVAYQQTCAWFKGVAPWIDPCDPVNADYRLVPVLVLSAIGPALGAWLSREIARLLESEDDAIFPLYGPLYGALICSGIGLDDAGAVGAFIRELKPRVDPWSAVGCDHRLFERHSRVVSRRLGEILGVSHAQLNVERIKAVADLDQMRSAIWHQRQQSDRKLKMGQLVSKVGSERARWLVEKARFKARAKACVGR